jgi:hypothetical protein
MLLRIFGPDIHQYSPVFTPYIRALCMTEAGVKKSVSLRFEGTSSQLHQQGGEQATFPMLS